MLAKMSPQQMKDRTKAFALRIIKLVNALPPSRAADVIGRQLLRSGTSVGANYRAVCRARTKPDFLNKLGVVEEEADESAYWLEILADANLVKPARLEELTKECGEITAIIVAAIRTARKRRDG
jgi:four helix bundle protein